MIENPTFVTRPEHLGRICIEKGAIAVRPATITTGQPDIPDIPGIAVTVSGAARIVLPVHEGWKLADALMSSTPSSSKMRANRVSRAATCEGSPTRFVPGFSNGGLSPGLSLSHQ